MRIVDANLISSAGKLEKLPEPTLPEVAFAGRSNVGKSSLLNAVCNRKSLFKVSKNPGRTRTIVHVEARLAGGPKLYLVDLPGFGFAQVSKGAMVAWQGLIEKYLSERSTLHLVVVLVDARRGPEQEEADLFDYLANIGVPALLAATKIDKLPKNKRGSALANLRRTAQVDVMGTSALDRTCVDDLVAYIAKASGYSV